MSDAACPDPEVLAAWAAGDLAGGARAEVVRHVEGCSSCREAAAILAQMESSDGARSPSAPPKHPPDAADDAGSATNAAGPVPLPGPGDRFGPFTIERVLGRGGMGVVLLARDTRLDREVALKLAQDEGEGSGARRLRREAKTLAALRHPNLVAVHEVGEEAGRPWLAMELVRGQTLRAWVAAERPPWREVLSRCLEAASGVEALHAAGFLHRDLKPDNLMLSEDGRVLVVDLGLAHRPDSERGPESTRTRTGAIVGTPRYLAPERVAGAPAGVSSDVYALAATTLELLRAASNERSRLPAGIVATLTHALDPDPRERPATIAALREALTRELRPRWPAWAAGGAVLALGALAVRLASSDVGAVGVDPAATMGASAVSSTSPTASNSAEQPVPRGDPHRASLPPPPSADASAPANATLSAPAPSTIASASGAPELAPSAEPPPSPSAARPVDSVAVPASASAMASAPLISGPAAPQLMALASARPDLIQVDPRPFPPTFTREWMARMDYPPITFEVGYAKVVDDFSDCNAKPAAEVMFRGLDWGKVEKVSTVELTNELGKKRPEYLVMVSGELGHHLFYGHRDGTFLDAKPGDWVLVQIGRPSKDVVPAGFEAAKTIHTSDFAPIGGPPAWARKKPRPSYLPCGARLHNPTGDPRSNEREWKYGQGSVLFSVKDAPKTKLGPTPQYVDGALLEAATLLPGAEHLEKASRKNPIWVIGRYSRIESYKDTPLAVMHVEEVLPTLVPPPK